MFLPVETETTHICSLPSFNFQKNMWNYKHPEKRISTLCSVAVAMAHSKLFLCICSIRPPQKCKRKKKTYCVFAQICEERDSRKRKSQTTVTRGTSRAAFLMLYRNCFLQIFVENSIIKLFVALEGRWKCSQPSHPEWMVFSRFLIKPVLKHIKILLGWISSFFTAHSCSISVTLSGNEIHFRALPLMSCRV